MKIVAWIIANGICLTLIRLATLDPDDDVKYGAWVPWVGCAFLLLLGNLVGWAVKELFTL